MRRQVSRWKALKNELRDANYGPGPRTAGGRSKRRAKRISRTSPGIEKTTVNAIPANMALISSHLTAQ
jgi:hypothetical protein